MYKAHRIQAEIDRLEKELCDHQVKCKHKRATKKYRGSTGNYDPSADSYWIEWDCPTCLNKWTTEQ